MSVEHMLVGLVSLVVALWLLVAGVRAGLDFIERSAAMRMVRRVRRGQVSPVTKVLLAAGYWVWRQWRERVALRNVELDDPRLQRTSKEASDGTLFYWLQGWWEVEAGGDHVLLAHKYGITTNLKARVRQINTATPLKIVVALTLPLGLDFEQHILHLTRHARTTGMGEEWRRADDATVQGINEQLRELARGREVSLSDA